MMKKLFLFCFLILSVFPLRAEEYSLTSLINYPAGIFDTLYSGGNAYFQNAEIGARDWGYELVLPAGKRVLPIMQKQTLLANGAINFGMANLIVDGTLQINNATAETSSLQTFSFGNIYVYPPKDMTSSGKSHSSIFSAANLTGGATVYASEVNAFGAVDIGLPASFSAGGVEADKLSFFSSALEIPFPMKNPTGPGSYTDGSVIDWKQVKNAASSDPNEYGAWEQAAAALISNECNDNYQNAYQCNASDGAKTCIDIRTLTDYYDTVTGGLYVSKILARKECEYTGSVCSMSGYKLDIFSSDHQFVSADNFPECEFDITAFNEWRNDGEFGLICRQPRLCGTDGSQCDSTTASCYITLDNDILSSGAEETARWSPSPVFQTNQPGIDNCQRTVWPEGSGLECTNAWEERYALVITCGQGSGNLVNTGRRQKRTVTCNKADETGGNYYLVLN
ncbi:MAG: hypothetical protein LBG46_06410 [Elusimicrobiota bacterium]|jgi:hypothetical protein|nr:hypothetical protein [Elusimicrobiota bacterium]